MPTFEWNQGEQDHYRRLFRILADHLDERPPAFWVRLWPCHWGKAVIRRFMR